jgi:hypothetical protein
VALCILLLASKVGVLVERAKVSLGGAAQHGHDSESKALGAESALMLSACGHANCFSVNISAQTRDH